MDTYLLTWNPERFSWDQPDSEAIALAKGQTLESRWSCGNSTSIQPGSRIFMLRQGRGDRGIVAAGRVIRGTYQDLHWDRERAEAGENTNFVRIRLDAHLRTDGEGVLRVQSISTGALSEVYWPRPASGTRLEPRAAAELEILWGEHRMGLSVPDVDVDPELSLVEGHQRIRLARHKQRERVLREAKIRSAIEASADGRLRCEVPGCGFDFEEKYGELGRGFCHVHHLKPLSSFDAPVPVGLGDLAVVCPNCHAMVHLGGKCRAMDSLIPTKQRLA